MPRRFYPYSRANSIAVFKASRPRLCTSRREVDEYVCSTCGLRWGTDEDKPKCPK